MKITNEWTSYSRITKQYEIELDSGKIIKVSKWWHDDEYDTDGGTEYDELVYQQLTEEEQEALDDFIIDLK